ncbi:hypothetical protein [Haloferula sp. BvORR071]|uniref:hypothetical protein n=1 Tax=Haloferula sp. BvORR071 TaxID=1396141 RepID=UPI002240EFAF|nr:hypothetical protein [Haloferula sp. BvORR071]
MKWLAFAMVAYAATAGARADFVAPAEGPVPFRRDRLPVDVETMGTLSRQVLAISGAKLGRGPEASRALAQMTALALALDPANRQAREQLEKLQAGEFPEHTDGKELERSLSRAWQLLDWLEMPEAGADGHALAACLGDVLAFSDPRHPKANALKESGEQGAWAGWIAPESAFGKKVGPKVKPRKEDDGGSDPLTPDKPPVVANIALPNVSSLIPAWPVDKDGAHTALELVPVELAASPASEGEGVTIGFSAKPLATANADAAKEVQAFLGRRHQTGGPVHALVTPGKDLSPTWNGASLSGSSLLLADGALSGKAPGAIALAVVGKDGKLELPPHFWENLRSLAAMKSAPGGRLIVPAAGAEYLAGLLVLDNASFFMNWEVVVAANVDELCDLGSGTPKPEAADAYGRFAEIRKAAVGKPLGTFISNPSVLTRLRDLGTAMPQHASARLLTLQGSNNRPRALQRNILAREIRDAIEPIREIENITTEKLVPKRLDEIFQQCREKLDKMGSYIDIRDRDLHKAAVAAADEMRALARQMGKSDNEYPYEVLSKQIAAHKAAWRAYVATLTTLTEAAGDQAEYTIPKVSLNDNN